MSEISTVAIIKAKPENADDIAAGLIALATATHAEPGCILYSLQRGVEDPNTFVTIEKWESMEALQGHMHSPHMAEAMKVLGGALAESPIIVPGTALPAGDPAKSAF